MGEEERERASTCARINIISILYSVINSLADSNRIKIVVIATGRVEQA